MSKYLKLLPVHSSVHYELNEQNNPAIEKHNAIHGAIPKYELNDQNEQNGGPAQKPRKTGFSRLAPSHDQKALNEQIPPADSWNPFRDAAPAKNLAGSPDPTTPPKPPPGATLYIRDAPARPCEPDQAYMWTWEGAQHWYHTDRYPAPGARR